VALVSSWTWSCRGRLLPLIENHEAAASATAVFRFELRAENEKLRPFTTRSRWVSVVGIAFLLLLGALAVGANAHNLATRTFPVYETAGLIIILIVVVGCIALTIPSLYRLKPGAIRLMIDDLGFDLVYEDGKVVRENWSDPTINFQLYDFSETSPGALRTPGLPYSIVVRGVTTVL
jgi:hypothetical protein